jgi:hypothetical protein
MESTGWILHDSYQTIVPPDVKPGDFILFPMRPPLGWLIRLGQIINGDGFSDFEHSAVYVGMINGEHAMVEAMPGGARVSTVQRYGNVPSLWSTGKLHPTDAQRKIIVDAAMDIANRKVGYSFLMYLAFALHMFHLPIPLLKWYIGNTHHLICSQLVALCYYKAGMPLCDANGRWSGYVTPGDLYQYLRDAHEH